ATPGIAPFSTMYSHTDVKDQTNHVQLRWTFNGDELRTLRRVMPKRYSSLLTCKRLSSWTVHNGNAPATIPQPLKSNNSAPLIPAPLCGHSSCVTHTKRALGKITMTNGISTESNQTIQGVTSDSSRNPKIR